MSSPEQRRNSPRRRVRGSRMHPGWEVFLLAFASGLFTMATMLYVMVHFDWGFTFGAVIAIALFIIAGRKAEGLTDDEQSRTTSQ